MSDYPAVAGRNDEAIQTGLRASVIQQFDDYYSYFTLQWAYHVCETAIGITDWIAPL